MGDWRSTGLGSALMFVWALVMVPITVIGILLAAPVLGPRRAFFTVGPFYGRAVAWFCRIPFSLEGWERMPTDIREGRQPVIFMSNHESQLDPPYFIAALPLPAVYIAKQELKLVPFIGWACWAAGVIFIDRRDRERARRSIDAACQQIRGGKSVVIFPEGTRTPDGSLLPFKKGGFALALDAGVPIIPLAIVGSRGILPKGSVRLRPGRFRILVGDPVTPGDFADKDLLSAEVRGRIEALLAQGRA